LHAGGLGQPADCDAVDRLQHLRGQDVLGEPGGDDLAAVEQHEPVAVAGGEVQIVQHHDRRDPDAPHQVQHLVLVADVEVVGGLVEQQMICLLGQCASDQHPLLLATRELPVVALSKVPGSDAGQRRRRNSIIGTAVALERSPVRRAAEEDHLGNRQRDLRR
jgi:hypothetical protein